MSNPKPLQTDDFCRHGDATKLIRELAVKPPVKGMANVKAATDVFEANLPENDDLHETEPARRTKGRP